MNAKFKYLILIVTCWMAGIRCYGQYPLAAGSPQGIFIFLDNHIPSDGHMEIQRAQAGKNRYSSIGSVYAPTTREELAGRIHFYENYFPDLGNYTDADIDRMWKFINKSSVIDTLPPVNYPVMHLAAGTAFLDTIAAENENYQYKITYYKNNSASGTKNTGAVSFPGHPELPVPEIYNQHSNHKQIFIEWYIKPVPELFSFRVYRRQNMAGEFKRIDVIRGFYNREDSLFLIMQDTLLHPDFVYEYYIETLDRLNNPGASSEIAHTSSFSREDVPLITHFDISKGREDHTVDLHWNFDHHDLVRSISIMRSQEYDSGYVKIAEVPPIDSLYTDHVKGASENYYYYLVLEGIMDRGFPSAVVNGMAENHSNPLPPEDVGAEPAENGIKIYWTHLDPSVTGYYVYRDNGLNDSLQQITGLIKPANELASYLDTSSVLSGNKLYRYAIRSVNDGYLLSALSDTVAGQPLMAIPPVTPVNLRGGFSGGKVYLIWDDLNEDDQYLAGYNIYRKSGHDDFEVLNSQILSFSNNTYTDSTISSGINYAYAITSLNSSGMESSRSLALNIFIPDTAREIIPPGGFRLSRTDRSVILTWYPGKEENLNAFKIYRYLPGKSPELLATVSADTFSYTDNAVESGNLYFYFLTAESVNGKESEPTNPKNIKY